MLWSGSVPIKVVRDNMWGFLMFAGAAWLAIAWSILRLEPANVVGVAAPVLLFGALCEAVRALVGTKTWWLNAGMAVLFVVTAVVLVANGDSAYTTPESLVAWYLMVRGALDVAVSIMNRGVDRTWGLILTLGMAQAALGFYAAGPWARESDPVVVTLGALAMLRGVADLTTSLRLREVAHAHHDVLRLPPEREAGVAGYSAGLSDYPATQSTGRARHRANPESSSSRSSGDGHTVGAHAAEARSDNKPADAVRAEAAPSGGTRGADRSADGTGAAASGAGTGAAASKAGPGAAASKAGPGAAASKAGTAPAAAPKASAEFGAASSGEARASSGQARASSAEVGADPATDGGRGGDATPGTEGTPAGQARNFHDEVVKTTANLDSKIAEAGVTGTGTAQHRVPETLPPVPDTPEGVAPREEAAVAGEDSHRH